MATTRPTSHTDTIAPAAVDDDVLAAPPPVQTDSTTWKTTTTAEVSPVTTKSPSSQNTGGNVTAAPDTSLAAPKSTETDTSAPTSLAAPTSTPAPKIASTPAATGSASVSDTISGMLSDNSKYLQVARAGGLQEGTKRGLLNSSMSAEAGELAAIKAAAPLAQQDAGYWQSRGLAEQQSGLNTQENYVKGEISSKLQAEQAEYDRILSKQEAGQALTQQEQQYLMDYQSKAALSAQEASQDINMLQTKGQIDAYLIQQQAYVNSLLSAQEAGQELTAQQQKAIDDYNTASALQQQEAYQTQQLELIKQEGANTRQAAELSAQKEIEQMNISAQEKEIVSNAMITLGTELDQQISAISQNTNIPADAKAAMIAQQYELYYSNVNMALAAYGIRIEWEDL